MGGMEAIAGANRGGVAGCSYFRGESVIPTSGARNLSFPGTKKNLGCRSVGLRTARQPFFSSVSFEDQSHVQFYYDGNYGGRKKGGATSGARKAIAGLDVAMETERNGSKAVMKTKKMEMKAQKKLEKLVRAAAGVSSSSSSSSSSESELESVGGKMRTKERKPKSRRIDMEKLRQYLDSISASPLMNSMPTISSNFMIEQLQAQQLASPVGISSAAQPASVTSSAVVSEVLNGVIPMRMSAGVNVSSSSDALLTVPGALSAGAVGLEVCMGGKCKKAGAQEVLSAFHANGVAASACNKCMKKCKFAISVRVHRDDDNDPQVVSGIGLGDVNEMSQKYFGAGAADWG